jgi:hypothetical protein
MPFAHEERPMPVSLPAAGLALPAKLDYFATTWAMLADGSWDVGAARQLATFVRQLIAELDAVDVPVLATTLRCVCEQLDTAASVALPPSAEAAAGVTAAIIALGTHGMAEVAAQTCDRAAPDGYGTVAWDAAPPPPLRERSVGAYR